MPPNSATALEGFLEGRFTALEEERTVYRIGAGPPVLIMHEIPGIIPEVAEFARRVAEAGFTAVVPHLFGEPGREFSVAYSSGQIRRACIRREFSVLARHEASPITEWLRALSRSLHDEFGGRGVGALGMCLTGNFALALMVDPWLMAPVLSQPSLPFPVSPSHKRALHVSADTLGTIKRRASEEGVPVLGLRFTEDRLCPPQRFETLREAFGERFEGIEIDSSRGNAHGISRIAHSVVTRDLIDEEGHPTRVALARVLEFFAERLL